MRKWWGRIVPIPPWPFTDDDIAWAVMIAAPLLAAALLAAMK